MGTAASSDTRLDPPPHLQEAGAYAAPVATCDVVMKGGITSGIVYPWAVCDLATRYRLVNVGGASAGAIAAAAAAAAEYGRTQGGGFPVLAGLPGQLGAQTKGQSLLFSLFQPQRRTAPLFALLATSLGGEGGGSRTRLALHGLRAAASARGGWLRLGLGALLGLVLLVAAGGRGAPAALALLALVVAGGVAGVLRRLSRRAVITTLAAAAALLAGIALAAVLQPPERVTVAVVGWLVLVVGLAVGTVLVLGRILLREVPENLYGVCSGLEGESTVPGAPALTPWLADVLDQAAGTGGEAGPLTFGQLWAGPGAERLSGSSPRPRRPAINLEVMTTCLTRGRPYRVPLDVGDLYFSPDEMRRLFPEAVVAWMERCAAADAAPTPLGTAATDSAAAAPHATQKNRLLRRVRSAMLAPLVPFPAPADVPVVVAARMSLSFPILISAVPLYVLDRPHNAAAQKRITAALEAELAGHRPGDTVGEDEVVAATLARLAGSSTVLRTDRLWFSDGGITSNFPIHFFDSFAPLRPTFGVNLRPHHPDHPPTPSDECSAVYLPGNNSAGRGLAPNNFDAAGPSLVGFLTSILDTMQNWRDSVQMPLPGFRDRIAHVGLDEKIEGGLHLTMPADVIGKLALRGYCAGHALRTRFSTPDARGWTGWESHRWARLRSNLALLEGAATQVQAALGPDGRHPDGSRDLRDLLDGEVGRAPAYQWDSPSQRQRARDAVDHVLHVAPDGIEADNLSDGAPRPLPALRTVPRE